MGRSDDITPGIRFRILQRDHFTCQYCGKKNTERELHVDHVVSYKLGGPSDDYNLVTSCPPCNLGKGSAWVDPSLLFFVDPQRRKQISRLQVSLFSQQNSWPRILTTEEQSWLCKEEQVSYEYAEAWMRLSREFYSLMSELQLSDHNVFALSQDMGTESFAWRDEVFRAQIRHFQVLCYARFDSWPRELTEQELTCPGSSDQR